MYEIEFEIREPKVSWVNRIIFSFALSLFFTLVYYIIRNNILDRLTLQDLAYISVHLIGFIVAFIAILFPLVMRKYIQFNFSSRKIRHSFSIGLFKFDEKWQDLVELNYISVFNTDNGYEVNLWYKKNKVLNLFVLQDFDEVIKKALFFSDKLNIDLVDARNRGYHKRIDIEVYRKTGKIEYSE